MAAQCVGDVRNIALQRHLFRGVVESYPLFLANLLGVRTAVIGLYGLYNATREGAAKALVADLVPPAQRGTAYALFNTAIGITVFPASLIAGLLWQGIGAWTGFGPSAPFFFGAFMALLAGLLFARLVK